MALVMFRTDLFSSTLRDLVMLPVTEAMAESAEAEPASGNCASLEWAARSGELNFSASSWAARALCCSVSEATRASAWDFAPSRSFFLLLSADHCWKRWISPSLSSTDGGKIWSGFLRDL